MPDTGSANSRYRAYRDAGLDPNPARKLAGEVEALAQDQSISGPVRARLRHCGPREAQDLVDVLSATLVARTLRGIVGRRPELFTPADIKAADQVQARLGEVAHAELTRLGL